VTDRAAGVPFAKEGFPFIGAAAGITLIAWWLGWIPVAVVGAMLTRCEGFPKGLDSSLPRVTGSCLRSKKNSSRGI
jgi:hypothetical protein